MSTGNDSIKILAPYAASYHKSETRFHSQAGVSIMELLVSMLILGFLSSSVVSNLSEIKNPLYDSANQSLGFIKQVRAKALSSTLAYEVFPVSSTQLATRFATSCSVASEDMELDSKLTLPMPDTVSLTETDWSICFSSRGLAQGSESFSLVDEKGKTRTLEVFLGGAARIQ